MQNGYVYVFACVAMVGIGIFAMYYASMQSWSNVIAPQTRYATPDCVGYYPKAEKLAENSVGQATMSSYSLQNVGIQCIWGNSPNGTRELLGVKLDYQSNNPSIGLLTVTEDPQFTKVINATVLPSEKFSGSTPPF